MSSEFKLGTEIRYKDRWMIVSHIGEDGDVWAADQDGEEVEVDTRRAEITAQPEEVATSSLLVDAHRMMHQQNLDNLDAILQDAKHVKNRLAQARLELSHTITNLSLARHA